MKRFVAVLAVVALAAPAIAQVPGLINYQGRLVNGTSLVNRTVSLVMRVYDDPVLGSLIAEDSNDVAVVDGLYATFLGDNMTTGSLADIVATTNAWLEVNVDGAPLAPRERIVSVAYALNAGALGGFAASQFATGTPLYVYSETDPRWASASNGMQNQINAKLATSVWIAADSTTNYVRRTGDTMTGSLTIGAASDANGTIAFAHGSEVHAYGNYSHAEGYRSTATADGSHAEGLETQASLQGGHAEGSRTVAAAVAGHAEGSLSEAHGTASHAEGIYTLASGAGSHSEGTNTVADAPASHAEGDSTTAMGVGSHAEGFATWAEGDYSHAEGSLTAATGDVSHADGYRARALHPNTFVWADKQDADFDSTATNQFLIRAAGGVGIGTNVTPEALTVAGRVKADGFIGDGSGITNFVNRTGDTMTGILTVNVSGSRSGIVIESAGEDVCVGGQATGSVAIGWQAQALSGGSAVGSGAMASDGGTAVGGLTDGSGMGTAVGYEANGFNQAAAVGYNANAANYGVAVGHYAKAPQYNTAVGFLAAATGVNQTAIGREVTNDVDESIRVRGDLYLDGGTKIYYRTVFNAGAFSDILGGYVKEFELTALSNNLVAADFATNYVRRTGDTMSGSLAIGLDADATGVIALAHGLTVHANADYSHAEGHLTTASGSASHSEGEGSQAFDEGSHAEGINTSAHGRGSHSEGEGCEAFVESSHAEGHYTYAGGWSCHAEGEGSFAAGQYNHAEGITTLALGIGTHAEGCSSMATGFASHAEGCYAQAAADYSHAEGTNTVAEGRGSHAEGHTSRATGVGAHAEGHLTTALGPYSHAEGENTRADGPVCHAEGNYTIATGFFSHAEGSATEARGNSSHAEGEWSVAAGNVSHAGGQRARTLHNYTFVWADSSDTNYFDTAAINQFLIRAAGGVGIGTNSPGQALEVAGNVKANAFYFSTNAWLCLDASGTNLLFVANYVTNRVELGPP